MLMQKFMCRGMEILATTPEMAYREVCCWFTPSTIVYIRDMANNEWAFTRELDDAGNLVSITTVMMPENWGVNKNWLSKDYEDSALETSTPFKSYEKALDRYEQDILDWCTDNKRRHCRCRLEHRVWDGNLKCHVEILKANYKGGMK